jgi:serine/threonine protein kinase
MATIVPPDTISNGRFRIESLFGSQEEAEGGQATVFRGVDTKTGQIVAVKVFRTVSEDAVAEYAIGQRINHPNAIQFFELDQTINGGRGAIVMEAANFGAFFNSAID